MKRQFLLAGIALCAMACVLRGPARADAHWVGTVYFESTGDYPLHSNVSGDTWTSDALGLVSGAEVWARITRTGTASDQGAVAYEVDYHITWNIVGSGDPGPIAVYSTADAVAYAFVGTSHINNPGYGGDFGYVGVNRDISVGASTDGHAAAFTDSHSVSIEQPVAYSDTVTTNVRMHPTAGVTTTGDYKSYAKVWWITYSGPGGAG